MKTVLLPLVLAAVIFTVGGCALMSDEDRDFYGKGWVKPSELDKPMPHHALPDPSRPEQADASARPADGSARTASADADPQWLVPEQAPR